MCERDRREGERERGREGERERGREDSFDLLIVLGGADRLKHDIEDAVGVERLLQHLLDVHPLTRGNLVST
jgi:hypothetical protein